MQGTAFCRRLCGLALGHGRQPRHGRPAALLQQQLLGPCIGALQLGSLVLEPLDVGLGLLDLLLCRLASLLGLRGGAQGGRAGEKEGGEGTGGGMVRTAGTTAL